MLFLRPVELEDLDALLEMSIEVGSGMTSMPNDEGTWLSRVTNSKDTFAGLIDANKSEGVYFLVAEDSDTQTVVGTTAIYVGIGTRTPFYSYKSTLIVQYSDVLKKTIENRVLHLVNDFTRAAELGSLFLRKPYRHSGYGQFMSRSRYLMLADFPDQFDESVMAELRGWQNAEGHSPFWQALGKKFFDLPFENADYISATKGTQFIQELMPKYPVYVDLLPEEAQACIGKPHDISAKAIHMLEKEGFYYDGYVDLFDGGPTVHCRKSLIRSVRETTVKTVSILTATSAKTELHDPNQRYMISNRNIAHYRITIAPANVLDNTLEITAECAAVLGVTAGDSVSLIAMEEK
ncbi:arginine N-succinyltransferase [Ostreibacterium oceani]|uniref:Arginine N-succinyltransferase n=1 Tax=Ostreibacterium oceani TaxID=2654998 RepID=A0A6N7EYY5_9GAMM|nr:arginine N-succinyltransferase [Ostreibacterium oceani]MPV86770.1 hypothetical protein [Ostreibacterium oceani]